jgi:hypothetical protein
MPRPKAVGNVAVVARALVDIVDHQLDRRAGGLALEHAGQDLHLVRLAPLRRVARLARPALVEPVLDVGFGERDPGGTPSTTTPIAGPWLSPQS